MIEKIMNFADEFGMLPGGGAVLVCVSGGADSMCLLEVMRHISYQRGFDIIAAHFNHKLRGDESDRDETFVLNVCEAHGIPLHCRGDDIHGFAKKLGVGIEEAAREARYGFFRQTAEKTGAYRIATAHTMNDNTETVIMNLTRGTGTNGMAGIAPVRDNIIRPMLCVTRDEIIEFLEERDIAYVEDSTNKKTIYTRNKIRHKVIPVLEKQNPRLNDAVFAASELMRNDEEFIAEIADLFINDCCAGLTADAKDLAILPFSVSSRVIKKLYGKGSLSLTHVKDVLALCETPDPSAGISLPGMNVYREYDRIVFDAQAQMDDTGFAPIHPIAGGNYILLAPGLTVTCKTVIYDGKTHTDNIHKPFTTFLFKSIDLCGKISVRPRQQGDTIRLKGHSGTKTLKKLFIEKKIPARKRAKVPVICDEEGVLGICGIGVADRAVPAQGDMTLVIEFKELSEKI